MNAAFTNAVFRVMNHISKSHHWNVCLHLLWNANFGGMTLGMHYVGLLSVSLSIYIYLSISLPLFVKASFLKASASCIQLSKSWQVEGTSQCVQTANPQICKQNTKYVVQFLEHMFRSIWVKWICVSYMTNNYFEYILAFVCVLLTCRFSHMACLEGA